MLQMLPKNITPVNLEELRRVKQQLVELESRAENIVCVLPSPSAGLNPSDVNYSGIVERYSDMAFQLGQLMCISLLQRFWLAAVFIVNPLPIHPPASLLCLRFVFSYKNLRPPFMHI